MQHYVIGFYNRDGSCLLRGTTRIFHYNSVTDKSLLFYSRRPTPRRNTDHFLTEFEPTALAIVRKLGLSFRFCTIITIYSRSGTSSYFDRATVVYIPSGLSLQINRPSFHPSSYSTSIWIPLVFSPGWLPAVCGSGYVAHAYRWQKAKTVSDSDTSMFNKMSIRVTITDDRIYGTAVVC
jgi:hypothetical protein